jgi:hypothetical protein
MNLDEAQVPRYQQSGRVRLGSARHRIDDIGIGFVSAALVRHGFDTEADAPGRERDADAVKFRLV